MNYQKHYDALILRARSRKLDTYVENHHVLPKSLGGTDDAANIVALTPEEHYLAHQLLVKIYEKLDNQPAYRKMLFALNLMSGKSNLSRSNRYYGWIRRKVSEAKRGHKHTQESKDKNSQSVKNYWASRVHPNKGKPLSESQKMQLSQKLKGRQMTEEHKQKISQSLKGVKRKGMPGDSNPSYKHVSDSICNNIVDLWHSGIDLRVISQRVNLCAQKVNSILQSQTIDITIRECPHCNKIGDSGNMLRWHFDKCKYKCV